MLDANMKSQLTTYLEKLVQPIEIVASLDDGDKSRELQSLLQEIAGLSPKITLIERSDGAERAPSFAINRQGEDTGIRFAGIPMGHEFTSLVLALLQAGGHPPKVDADVIDQISNLEGEFHFQTYISLSCQNCPDVVQALNMMAVLNPGVRQVTIDGALFQQEVEDRQIMAVPTVYMNGEMFGQGRMSLEEILGKLDTGAGTRDAEKLNAQAAYDVLIVGGGPAGASAAVYAARKGIRTGIVAERFGGQVMDTMSIENYISVPETTGPELVAAMEQHVLSYDVDIFSQQRAESLSMGDLVEIKLANGAVLKSRSVILAPGARWRKLGVPGEEDYLNKGVAYCPHCDGPLFKGKPVAVIGGGNSGVEAAIDLAGLVKHVTLIEFGPALRADAVLERKLHSLPNVSVITNAQTTEIHGNGSKVTGLSYRDREADTMHQVALDGIFIQIGLVPNTEWLKGSVELSRYGEIVINDRGQTSLPGVFAAGDATTVPFKQIIIAAGQGSTAALAAFDYLIRSSAPAETPAELEAEATA